MLKNRLLLSISAGHFAVDVLTSVVLVLLATLAVPLVLSNAQIGVALTIQIFAGALSQPLFGWLADRFSATLSSWVSGKSMRSVIGGTATRWI